MVDIILCHPNEQALGASIANKIGARIGTLDMRHFPDGESYVRVDEPLAGLDVAFVCSLNRPDDKAMSVLFLATLAKQQGARSFGLVAPYLGYMRQDIAFKPGEAVTSNIFAGFLSQTVDWLITIDPHLHRHTSLAEIYTIPARALHAAPLLADWIKNNVAAPILIGPDIESTQWVAAVAEQAGAPFHILEKQRHGDREVEISAPQLSDFGTHTPVLVDDIISTARTMIETIKKTKQYIHSPAVCIGVHAIFAANAQQELSAAGAGQIVTTNTVNHNSNLIDTAALLADGIIGLTQSL